MIGTILFVLGCVLAWFLIRTLVLRGRPSLLRFVDVGLFAVLYSRVLWIAFVRREDPTLTFLPIGAVAFLIAGNTFLMVRRSRGDA